MIIAITAFKEKIRRKELYIVSVIGVLILLLFGTGDGMLSINGVAVTDYRVLAPILLTVVNAINCMLTVAMSLGTIPREYERGTSHLVWIRRVPQWCYHGELALANVTAGLVSQAILFVPLLGFMLMNGRADQLWKLLPAYLILGINVAVVGMLTSVLSVLFPRFAAGAVSCGVALAGIFHSVLGTLKDMVGGFGGDMIRYALKLIPSLHDIQAQAGSVLYGGKLDFHMILTGLLAVYGYTVLLLLLRRSSDPTETVHIRRGAERILAGLKHKLPSTGGSANVRKLVVLLIGAALVVGVIATGSYGLSQEDIAIYEEAVALEESIRNIGFEDFALTDYLVAFYDGDRDHVLTWEQDGYHVEKRRAVFSAIVATAYPVDDHYEVLAPTVDKMSSVLGMISMGNSGYGAEEQIATIWHEAFHCYQLTHFSENVEAIFPQGIDESVIVTEADGSPRAVSLFRQQAQLLEDAVKTEDVDRIRECIVKYKELDEERKQLLPAEVIALEDYYTRVEGSACYVEACIYKILAPDSFESAYTDIVSEYVDGSAKYYHTGMAQCMILDKLNPEWKAGFDFSEPMMELIYRELDHRYSLCQTGE
ncbi:MAG: hypothetical protein K2K19_05785 [Acetatifactor sp.]|nr:hypothetical protein [Acetatifactor sp.]